MQNATQMIADYLARPGPHLLEIGAGPRTRPGWLCTDLDGYALPGGAMVVPLNATAPFPLPPNTFDAVYCEHMIEHIPFQAGRIMLDECFRILKPGGVIRIVTPSIEFIHKVMTSAPGSFAYDYLQWAVKNSVPDAPAVTNAFFFNTFVREWGHVFIYDEETLELSLHLSGFDQLTDPGFFRSQHTVLQGLENRDRMPDGYLELESMVREAIKPAA